MKYAKPEWRNGQPYNDDFEDVYFSVADGMAETEYVFITHNDLIRRFKENTSTHFVIAETGFGSGLNFLLSARHWLQHAPAAQVLHFYSVENSPLTPKDLKKAQSAWPEITSLARELQQCYQVASYGYHRFELFEGRVSLTLMLGDVEQMLAQLELVEAAKVDAWFLDGFAPGKNPQMWSDVVFAQMRRLSRQGSSFSTYTAAGAVKRGLIEQGFSVRKVEGHGKKRVMLCGELQSPSSEIASDTLPWFTLASIPRTSSTKACVIGAGIAGISTAWSLVKRGYQVKILDSGGELGCQASGNPQGMIMPRLSLQDAADSEFYLSAYFYTLRCLQTLDPQQQVWKQTGGLQLPSSERIKRQIEEYPLDPALLDVVNPSDASRMSGITIKHSCHYFPSAATVQPKLLLARMLELMGNKVSLINNCEVADIQYDGQQWQLLGRDKELLAQSDCLVVANAWQAKKFSALSHLHINPARGQLSLVQANKYSSKLAMPISYQGYMMPADKGLHVVGASFEMDDCDTQLRQQEDQANMDDMNTWLKLGLDQQAVTGGRASVRAVTPDRVPVVGALPDVESYQRHYGDLFKGKKPQRYPVAEYLPGLYINAGHGARGFSSAMLCSEILAAMICAEPLPVSNRVRYALHPARFLIRTLKKKRQ